MANSADPDQLAPDLDLLCLQRQEISGFSRIRVNAHQWPSDEAKIFLAMTARLKK